PSAEGGTTGATGTSGTVAVDTNASNRVFGDNGFRFQTSGSVANARVDFATDNTHYGQIKEKLRGWVYLKAASTVNQIVRLTVTYSDSSTTTQQTTHSVNT